MSTPKALETRWKGYRFRSRLEARWAVYFDALPLKWEYEPEGFHLGYGIVYLPDFWLPQVEMWAEVKPVAFSAEEREKAFLLAESSGYPVIMLVGTPAPIAYLAIEGYAPEGCVVDGDGIYEEDYILDTSYLDEHRFFASTGLALGEELPKDCRRDVHAAVEAARSARFR